MVDKNELKYQLKRFWRLSISVAGTFALVFVLLFIFFGVRAYQATRNSRSQIGEMAWQSNNEQMQKQDVNDVNDGTVKIEYDDGIGKIEYDDGIGKIEYNLDNQASQKYFENEQKTLPSITSETKKPSEKNIIDSSTAENSEPQNIELATIKKRMNYVVKRGDSTWQIAKERYGKAELYVYIEQENSLRHNQWLKVDQKLVLPSDAEMKLKINRQAAKSDNTVKQRSATLQKKSNTVNQKTKIVTQAQTNLVMESDRTLGEKTYLVVKGDCLWQIAATQTGDSQNWTRIYAKNKTAVGNDPNLIYPGMMLKIEQ